MHKSSTRLADGREIVYYDRVHDRGELPIDRRVLPARTAVSRVRYDLPTGDWVVVAGHRQARGFGPVVADCPLCPSRDGRLTEVPAEDYDVVVFENRFPALTDGTAADDSAPDDEIQQLLRSAPAAGRCEVICFSSDHDTTFAELKADHARLVLDAWTDRTRTLAAIPGVEQVFCFENRGPEMGVSQPHPHGQIYAYPFVTPRTKRMLAQATDYRLAHGTNMFDDLLDAEIVANQRIIRATDEWVAFVPYAARWPFEVHLYPRRRRTDLTALDEAQRDGFASIYLDMLQRFERLFDTPTPYVSAWHQAPGGDPAAEEFAVHVELFTSRRSSERLKVLGGTEVAMDSFSNDVGPELAAERLRELGD
jgi:UDPglucose--hexose-1-phosphate uridylyltransferase